MDANDNDLCIFRSITVHRAVHQVYNKRQTNELASSILNNNRIRWEWLHRGYFPLIECHF